MAGHNEIMCHSAGERRQNYLNQIKCILEKMDDTPCERDPGGTAGQDPTAKPLIEYPGYINHLNPKFNKPFYVPQITNVPIREIRKTSRIDQHRHEIGRDLDYVQVSGPTNFHAPTSSRNRAKSMQLLGGYVISGCGCLKRNGLQDQCPRSECTNNPQCLDEPFPTCPPAMAYAFPEPQRDMNDMIEEAVARTPQPKLQYCCCSPDCGTRPSKPGAPLTHSKTDMPENFECYPCSQHK